MDGRKLNLVWLLMKFNMDFPMQYLKKADIPVLRMMNIERGYVVPNDLKYINLSTEQASKYLLNKGDILFNRTNSMEWVAVLDCFVRNLRMFLHHIYYGLLLIS